MKKPVPRGNHLVIVLNQKGIENLNAENAGEHLIKALQETNPDLFSGCVFIKKHDVREGHAIVSGGNTVRDYGAVASYLSMSDSTAVLRSMAETKGYVLKKKQDFEKLVRNVENTRDLL